MDYATARFKIAQKQLRDWKKNRGTAMDCSTHNERTIKIAQRLEAEKAARREIAISDMNFVGKILKNYFR